MKRITLHPNQVIVPGEYYLGDEQVLQIYFRIFNGGGGELLPRVVVVNNTIGSRERQERLWREVHVIQADAAAGRTISVYGSEPYLSADSAIGTLVQKYEQLNAALSNAPYFLIEGNHTTAAAALAHRPIYAVELETDADLGEVRRMVDRGELFHFRRSETTLLDLIADFERQGLEHSEHIRTVEQRVCALVANQDVPQYMVDRYQQPPPAPFLQAV